VKTITLEEIYADPHVLEPLLAGEDAVRILREGEPVATLAPVEKPTPKKWINPFSAEAHRAWFLKTHGPDAYNSTRKTADVFDRLRRPRSPKGE
jgi:antitoxin (DNA-binding transcriptional repressor) of toxin-antitoxin stability system